MPADSYFEKPGVSSHALADFRRDGPWFYYRKHVQKVIPDVERGAFAFGRGFHALTLEGEAAFWRAVVQAPAEHLAPSGGLSTKLATREWKAGQTQTVLTPNEVALIFLMAARVRGVAGRFFERGRPEVERFAMHHTGLALKGCADWDGGDFGVDLKSCGTLDTFEADARRYGYLEQAAFYCRLFGWSRFYLVAAEKEGERVAVYQVSESALTRADALNEAALCDLANCQAEDSWHDGSLVLVA